VIAFPRRQTPEATGLDEWTEQRRVPALPRGPRCPRAAGITVSVCADGWRSEFKYLVGPCSMERLLEEVLTGAGVLVEGGA
jgi:hypothetical protein